MESAHPSAQSTCSRIVFLEGSPLFLLVAGAKYPELRLVAQLLLDTSEAVCLQLPGELPEGQV